MLAPDGGEMGFMEKSVSGLTVWLRRQGWMGLDTEPSLAAHLGMKQLILFAFLSPRYCGTAMAWPPMILSSLIKDLLYTERSAHKS